MADNRIPDATLAEIRARVSIVEVISAHVALRKAGRSYLGLCPFHGEKTPSFNVNEEGGFFHCFGCGVGGNAFTFLTRIENISFPEAVRRLAAKAGVALPQTERDPQAQEQARLHRINDIAATYFQRCLWGNIGGGTRQYLDERGLTQAIAERFRLGFAPPGAEGLVRFLTAQKVALEKAASLGLIGKRDDGRYYDKFRHRLMFPITNVVGRIVGFGGRLLPMMMDQNATRGPIRTLPKYLNSSDSTLYKKGASLYGLFQAKEAIQKQGRAILVEGYIDLLSLAQHGQNETVAVLGTALGIDQLKLLRRFTQEVYIFFDGDEAGQRAAERAFPLCVEADVRGKGVFLPQEHDPDTFVREYGRDRLETLILEAKPLEDFYFTRHAPPPGASAFQRAKAAREAMAVLKSMTDVVARGAMLTQIAQRYGVNEEELRRTVTSQSEQKRTPVSLQPLQRREPSNVLATAETELLQLLLVDRRVAARVAQEGIVASFQQWRPLAEEVLATWQDVGRVDLGVFLDRLPKTVSDRVTRMYASEPTDSEEQMRDQLASDCIAKIRQMQKRVEREQMQRGIREAERQGDEQELRMRLHQFQQRERQE
jgi:DNA primase